MSNNANSAEAQTKEQKERDRQPKKKPDLARNRRVVNFLLQPYLQVKIGLFTNGLALIFSITMVLVFYTQLGDLISMIITLTDARDEVYEIAEAQLYKAKFWLFILTFLFLVGNVIISIFQTHKLVGPTIAFRRHIRDLSNGNFDKRVHLRRGDAFNEVAYELNRLAHMLEEREKERKAEEAASPGNAKANPKLEKKA